MLLILLACLGPAPDSTSTTTAFTSTESTDIPTTSGSTSETTEPTTDADADGDGWAVQADCDDENDDVHPGADDGVCDGVDDNCDGVADDEFDGDDHEPEGDGVELGTMEEEDRAREDAFVFPEGDEDHFLFYLEDGTWGWFSITVRLDDVPADLDLQLALELVEDVDGNDAGRVAYADEGGEGDAEELYYGGTTGFDDSGTYLVVISAAEGASCESAYEVEVVTGE